MRISKYFLNLTKEDPLGAQVISHKLMLRSSMIKQISSGIYAWLPLGLKVLNKVSSIVRKNMDSIGAVELLMPTIQPSELWVQSGRYEVYGKEMLKIKDRHDHEMLYGPTAEEVITHIFQQSVSSYKELPKILYNIQWKFRDEIRPRFGVMRGREFLMKDAYSFDLDFESAKNTYNKMYDAYINTFNDLGVKSIAVKADSGPIGGDMSHEFHILADTGESTIYCDKRLQNLDPKTHLEEIKKLYAADSEKHDPLAIKEEDLIVKKGIEVGHIFYFGTKYSDAFKLQLLNREGKRLPLEMGSYGIGVGRIVAAIIEASHDERGIIWPEEVAPFNVSLINLKPSDNASSVFADELYEKLQNLGLEVLYDDSDDSAGAKFAAHDLIGIPAHIIIGPRLVGERKVELKDRRTGSTEVLTIEELLNKLSLKFKR